MASLSQRACGRQVCRTNIVNLQFGNCPRTHSAWPFVAFEEKWHVFRGFPYGNWVVKYMAVSTKLLRMNILRRHHFAFTKIGRQLHAFLFSPKAFFRRNVTFSDGFVQNILMWNVWRKTMFQIVYRHNIKRNAFKYFLSGTWFREQSSEPYIWLRKINVP